MKALFSAVCTTIDYVVEHRSLMGPNRNIPYMAIHINIPKLYKAVYIWPQIVDIRTMPFCFVYSLPYTCSIFIVLCSCSSWHMRDMKVFIHCLCHLELGVPQLLKLLQVLGMIHRSKIVHKSYSSHDKIKEQCNLLCIVLNFRLS